jgi:hypothetical protein
MFIPTVPVLFLKSEIWEELPAKSEICSKSRIDFATVSLLYSATERFLSIFAYFS